MLRRNKGVALLLSLLGGLIADVVLLISSNPHPADRNTRLSPRLWNTLPKQKQPYYEKGYSNEY
jgi:hypothetical protein